jgi:aurora kinase
MEKPPMSARERMKAYDAKLKAGSSRSGAGLGKRKGVTALMTVTNAAHPEKRRKAARPPVRPGSGATVHHARIKTAAKSAAPPKKQFSVADFEFAAGQILGEGKLGKVVLARHKASKQIVAIKIMNKKILRDEGLVSQIRNEVEIHTRIRHRNVIRNYAWFQDKDSVYFVLERANGGNLFELWCDRGKRLEEGEAANYMYQLMTVMAFLHGKGVIHRDIKPENLLIVKKKHGRHTLKLADFGWSVVKRVESMMRTTLCGTLDYLPPEIVRAEEYDEAVDRWTIGVLLYELLLGAAPFQAETEESTIDRIESAVLEFPEGAGISEEAKDLIRGFLNPDPKARLSLAEGLSHAWIRKFAPQAQDDAAHDCTADVA